ncbi:MAG: hypothetical protein IT382_19735 [Deltaproteobacteria bacterium]|nr:hypothetical protein [Deltaproteobacteria bacterium]
MKPTALVLLTLAAATAAAAHEGHEHAPPPPPAAHAAGDHAHASPHGGVVATIDGQTHVEVLFLDKDFRVWFYDGDMKPVALPTDAKATVVVDKKVSKLDLPVAKKADGTPDDHLTGALALPAAQKASLVIQATLLGKARSARVEREAGAGGAALPYHDHTPLHGGLVAMSSDDHVELVAGADGTYRLWYTDAWRRPLVDGVKATLTVESEGGVKETLALTGPAADGELSGTLVGKGKSTPAKPRKVLLDGFAHGYPFKAQWEIGGGAAHH